MAGKEKSADGNNDDDEAVIIERMNDALKRAMNTKPETHGEMVQRRRDQVKHASDCAVHDAPAYKAGACTCGADSKARR